MSTSTTTAASVPSHAHDTRRAWLLAAVVARRRRGCRCAAPEREGVRRRQRGRVGRGVGARSTDERPAETGGGEREHEPDDEHGDHEDRNRPAFVLRRDDDHRSTRIVADAWRSGSGIKAPTRGRLVTEW